MKWKKLGAAVMAAAVMASTAVSAGALDVTADSVVVDEHDHTYYEWGNLRFSDTYVVNGDGTTLGVEFNYDIANPGDITDITIPETVNGKKVTYLDLDWFVLVSENLKSITIPDSIDYVRVWYTNGEGERTGWSPFKALSDIYYEGTREQYEKIECGIIFMYYSGLLGEGLWGMPDATDEEVMADYDYSRHIENIIEEIGYVTPSEFLFGDATIHFSDGTTAKTSEIGDVPKIPDNTPSEEFTSNGVTVTAKEGVIPEGAEFSAVLKEVTDDDFTYEFKFVKDGEKVDFDGKVTVKLPIPEAFLDKTLYVYRNEADGTQTFLPSKIENGYIIFETDHFSEYLITTEEIGDDNSGNDESSGNESSSDSETSSDSESSNNDSNTDDSKDENSGDDGKGDTSPDTGFGGFAVLGVVALAGAAVVVSRKRK